MIVSLEEVKEHLRYDSDDNDTYLEGLIYAADAAIRKHVDETAFESGVLGVDASIRHAALLLIGYWDNNRNGEEANGWYLPPAVLALLTPFRTPVAV